MARVLHEFQANSKAIAKEVNDNFEWVQEDINDMGEGLQTLFNGNLTELSNSLNEEIDNLNNNLNSAKLDVDLGNIGTEAYNTIYSNLAMNTSAGISVSSGWTATQNGWLSLWGRSGQGSYSAWLIDENEVFRNDQSAGGERAGRVDIRAVAFIAKGQVLTNAGGGSSNATFYPCIGGN